MKVLVTGATGFIGEALAEKLEARGDRVRALVRPTSRTEALARLGAELAVGHLGDAASLRAALPGVEAVVHLAGLLKARRREEFFAVNGEGTRALAEACADRPSPPRLVLVSSLAAAGPAAPERPRVEDDPPAPVSDYGRSKLAGEEAVRSVSREVRASIVRPPIVYGPGEKELMPQLLRMARLGVVVRPGFGEKRYSVVHVADLCDGILAVLDRGAAVGPPTPPATAALPGAPRTPSPATAAMPGGPRTPSPATAAMPGGPRTPSPATAGEGRGEGIYFLDSGEVHGWDAIALAACAAASRRARVLPVPEAFACAVAAGAWLRQALTGQVAMISFDKLREARQPAWTCSSARARAELGWAPRFDLARGMADAVKWYRERGEI